jgi:protein ImuB
VLKNPREERSAAQQISIGCLALEPSTRDLLEKLGVKTVGEFVNLPSSGVAGRFGPGAYHLHRLASGELNLPLQPEYPQPPDIQRLILDHAEIDIGRIMTVMQHLLSPLLQTISDRGHALAEILVWFRFDKAGEQVERIRPAAPTLDARQLLDLIRLRLHTVNRLCTGVVETALMGRSTAAIPKQLNLIETLPKRDLAAANRALARVRAELGDRAVIHARLREGHLPEGRFIWEPLDTISTPRPHKTNKIPLIRRFCSKPLSLVPQSQLKLERKNPDGKQMEPSEHKLGPYIVSGGWWQRPVHREYYYAETRSGEMQWVYFDRMRNGWFLQGSVE